MGCLCCCCGRRATVHLRFQLALHQGHRVTTCCLLRRLPLLRLLPPLGLGLALRLRTWRWLWGAHLSFLDLGPRRLHRAPGSRVGRAELHQTVIIIIPAGPLKSRTQRRRACRRGCAHRAPRVRAWGPVWCGAPQQQHAAAFCAMQRAAPTARCRALRLQAPRHGPCPCSCRLLACSARWGRHWRRRALPCRSCSCCCGPLPLAACSRRARPPHGHWRRGRCACALPSSSSPGSSIGVRRNLPHCRCLCAPVLPPA